MTHAMVKGANVPLPASAVRAVLTWSPGAGVPDVDASALLVGAADQVRSDADFVFYNQPCHPSGLVRHPDKQPGGPRMADSIEVDLSGLGPDVHRVILAASSDGGAFEQVPDLRLLLFDISPGPDPRPAEPLASFDVVPDTGGETALICGELYRRQGQWKFRALGQGYASGLVGLATDFGIRVQEDDEDGEDGEEPAAGQPPRPAAVPASGESAGPPVRASAAIAGTPAAPAAPEAAPPGPPQPAAPAAGPWAPAPPAPTQPAYGYPQPAPTVPAVPAYGYPQQPAPRPPAGYGYPPPQPAYGYPQQTQPAVTQPAATLLTLPPQGPQFQPGR